MLTIHARELQPDADVAACGAPLPFHGSTNGRVRVFHYLHLGPSFARCEDALGVLELTCAEGATPSSPYPPAFIARDVTARLRRYPRGQVVTDADAVARRVVAARTELESFPAPPPKGFAEDTDARTPALESIARMLLERYALPTDTAVQLMTSIRGVLEPEATIIARRMAESKDAVWAWDEAGASADKRARDEELARLRAEKEAAERAAHDATPNTKSCRALDVFITRRRERAPTTALAPDTSDFEHDGYAYFVFDASDLLGLAVPAGAFEDTNGEVMPPEYVIPLTVREVRELVPRPAPHAALMAWRQGKIDPSPVTAARTLLEPEGRWLVKEIHHIFAPHAADLMAQTVQLRTNFDGLVPGLHEPRVVGATMKRPTSRLWTLLVHEYARNGVRKDVAWSSIVELLTPAYEAMVPHDPRPVTEQRIVYVDQHGHERDTMPGPNERWVDANGQDCVYRVRTIPAVPWQRPPFPISQEEFSRVFDAAVRGGPSVLVGKDELLARKPADLSAFESFIAKLRPDPWRPVLAKMTRERTAPITSAEIEDTLRGEDLVERLDSEGHARVLDLMARLGWEKKEPVIDGARRKAFVRVENGDE